MDYRTGPWCLAICAMLTACTSDPPATWSYIYPATIAPSCATATCHSQLAARAGVELDDIDRAYALLVEGRNDVDGPFVFPGDPAGSPLVWLLDGDERTRMPPAAPLAAVERDAIVAWIVAGAPQ